MKILLDNFAKSGQELSRVMPLNLNGKRGGML